MVITVNGDKIISVLVVILFILSGCASDSATNISIEPTSLLAKFYVLPDGESPHPKPLILLVSGAEGGRLFDKRPDIIRDLQNIGFSVATIGYFAMPGLPDQLSRIPIDGFEKLLRFTTERENLDGSCVVFFGVSKGGELGLTVASRMSGIKAVVAVVPPDVVFQASNTTLAHHSSWTWRGEELPFVPYPSSLEALAAVTRSEKDYRQLHLDALTNISAVDDARIQIENINGPILFVSSKHDQYWPSAEMSQRAMRRLEMNNFPYYSEHVVLDHDHHVMNHPDFRTTVMKFLSTRVFGENGVCGADK